MSCQYCGNTTPCGCGIHRGNPNALPVARDCSGRVERSRTAPSGASSELFRPTTPSGKLFLTGKCWPGDKTLNHLDANSSGFVAHRVGEGQEITSAPEIRDPIVAQGHLVNARGELLINRDGLPILGEMPDFDKIWISGVVDNCGVEDPRMMVVKAPKSSVPIYLHAKDGYFKWGEIHEDGLCSTLFPDLAVTGRLLVIDQAPIDNLPDDCTCNPPWCIREYSPNLGAADCAVLTLTEDDNGRKVLTPLIAPSTGNSQLRFQDGCPIVEEEGVGIRVVDLNGVATYTGIDLTILPGKTEACGLLKLCKRSDGSVAVTFQEEIEEPCPVAQSAVQNLLTTAIGASGSTSWTFARPTGCAAGRTYDVLLHFQISENSNTWSINVGGLQFSGSGISGWVGTTGFTEWFSIGANNSLSMTYTTTRVVVRQVAVRCCK